METLRDPQSSTWGMKKKKKKTSGSKVHSQTQPATLPTLMLPNTSLPHTAGTDQVFTLNLGAAVLAHALPHAGLQTLWHVDCLVQLVQSSTECRLSLRILSSCRWSLSKWVGVAAIQERCVRTFEFLSSVWDRMIMCSVRFRCLRANKA